MDSKKPRDFGFGIVGDLAETDFSDQNTFIKIATSALTGGIIAIVVVASLTRPSAGQTATTNPCPLLTGEMVAHGIDQARVTIDQVIAGGEIMMTDLRRQSNFLGVVSYCLRAAEVERRDRDYRR